MDEYTSRQTEPTDRRTNEELFQVALTETDEDVAWKAIGELQRRGDRDIFERASQLCTAEEASKRRIGVDILGQLGWQSVPAFHEETLALLLNMLDQEQTPEVLNAIAMALGHHHDPRAIEPLTHHKNHSDPLVRFGVVHGLLGHENALAITTLIELSTDADTDVRDWATFGLGSQIDADTPAIRSALLARLTDEDSNTSGEAMVGLARRHDQRMVEPLLHDLEAGWSGSLLTEAATEIGDPRLYPILVRLREEWAGDRDDWNYRELEQAIAQCQPAADNL